MTASSDSESSHEESTNSTMIEDSSSESEADFRDIDENDIKLAQMRRAARKKRGKTGLEVLQTKELMIKSQIRERMNRGIRILFDLHTDTELSSICGALQLKVLLKGGRSRDLLLQYANVRDHNQVDEEKIENILKYVWEGVLWEYLQIEGQPCHLLRLKQPKELVLQLWRDGYLAENGINSSKFIPHFMIRNIKKRDELKMTSDLELRLQSISLAEEKIKISERKMISNHDYTQILSYFQSMNQLRNLETEFRQYLISELEISRSHVDSFNQLAIGHREQQSELEERYMHVTSYLNEQLAHMETLVDNETSIRIHLEQDIKRIINVMENFCECADDRYMVGGGTKQPLKLRKPHELHPQLRRLIGLLYRYKLERDGNDDVLRQRARCHVSEIDRLKERVRELEAQVHDLESRVFVQSDSAETLRQRFERTERALEREKLNHELISGLKQQTTNRYASQLVELETHILATRPMLRAAAFHSSPSTSKLALSLLRHFGFNPDNDTSRPAASREGFLRSFYPLSGTGSTLPVNTLAEQREMFLAEKEMRNLIAKETQIREDAEREAAALALIKAQTPASTKKSTNKRGVAKRGASRGGSRGGSRSSSRTPSRGGKRGDDSSVVSQSSSRTNSSRAPQRPVAGGIKQSASTSKLPNSPTQPPNSPTKAVGSPTKPPQRGSPQRARR